MSKIKVLNLYAGIGGNRKLWKNVDVTAIENNPEIANIYKDFFPEHKRKIKKIKQRSKTKTKTKNKLNLHKLY